MASVTLQAVRKAFGPVEVIHGIDLETTDGEFVALVGPSGCGKSTLLRMIAGLEGVSSGSILIDGREVNHLSPRERNVAMVFQSYALYPHMTVRQNMEFNLKLSGLPAAERRTRVEATAKLLEIGELLERRPGQLSGGQRQRVAMGRAVVRDPALFLFDEPLSNLDAKLRVQMRTEIKALHQKVRRTSLYVTHDQIEAMTLADRIVVLNKGRIEQSGSPLELYRTPANIFVAGFIGSPAMNLCDATGTGTGSVKLADGTSIAIDPSVVVSAGRPVIVGLRPEHLVPGGEGSGLRGTARLAEPTGALTHVTFDLAGQPAVAVIDGGISVRAGDPFEVSIKPALVHVFDKTSGVRLSSASAPPA